MTTSTNGTSQWASIIPAFGVVFSIILGMWTLQQSQIADVKASQLAAFTDLKDTIRQLRLDQARADDAQHTELGRRETEIKGQIAEIVHEREYGEFRSRMLSDVDSVKMRITALESTRPTTGELQAVTTGMTERINQLFHILVPAAH